MTTKEELQHRIDFINEEIKELQHRVADIEKEIDEIDHIADTGEMVEYGLWKPKGGRDYWYITDFYTGQCVKRDGWIGNLTDNERISIGNCFKTKEQAEKHFEHLKVETQLRDIAERLNKGEKIDFKNSDQDKNYLFLDEGDELKTDYATYRKLQGAIYCLDEDFKDVAIQEIGEDRLKEYLKS